MLEHMDYNEMEYYINMEYYIKWTTWNTMKWRRTLRS